MTIHLMCDMVFIQRRSDDITITTNVLTATFSISGHVTEIEKFLTRSREKVQIRDNKRITDLLLMFFIK